MSNASRARSQMYRHSAAGIMARRMYEMQPEVRMRRAIKAAIKAHRHPPAVNYGAMSNPLTKSPKTH
jgi:hypothetical protein